MDFDFLEKILCTNLIMFSYSPKNAYLNFFKNIYVRMKSTKNKCTVMIKISKKSKDFLTMKYVHEEPFVDWSKDKTKQKKYIDFFVKTLKDNLDIAKKFLEVDYIKNLTAKNNISENIDKLITQEIYNVKDNDRNSYGISFFITDVEVFCKTIDGVQTKFYFSYKNYNYDSCIVSYCIEDKTRENILETLLFGLKYDHALYLCPDIFKILDLICDRSEKWVKKHGM